MRQAFERGFKAWCENAAINYRARLGLPPTSPLNPRSLADKLGVRVINLEEMQGLTEVDRKILLEEDADSWSGFTAKVGDKHLIVLNSSHSAARTASNLAHELSHIILSHKPEQAMVSSEGLLMVTSYSTIIEEEANWLAGSLLLPRVALLEIARKRMPNAAVLVTYGVSEQMFIFRKNVCAIERQVPPRLRSSTAGSH